MRCSCRSGARSWTGGALPARLPSIRRPSRNIIAPRFRPSEHSGRLADVLAHLADFVETRARNQQKIQLCAPLPGAACLCVHRDDRAAAYLCRAGHRARLRLARGGAALPQRALIAISAFLQHYGLGLAIALPIGLFVAHRWLKVPANRLVWHRLPRHHAALSPLQPAAQRRPLRRQPGDARAELRAAGGRAPCRRRRRAQSSCARCDARRRRAGEGGLQPSIGHGGGRGVSSMLVAIVASGESSGRIGPALGRAASELERELDGLVATLVSLVEPLVLLMMGGLVLLSGAGDPAADHQPQQSGGDVTGYRFVSIEKPAAGLAKGQHGRPSRVTVRRGAPPRSAGSRPASGGDGRAGATSPVLASPTWVAVKASGGTGTAAPPPRGWRGAGVARRAARRAGRRRRRPGASGRAGAALAQVKPSLGAATPSSRASAVPLTSSSLTAFERSTARPASAVPAPSTVEVRREAGGVGERRQRRPAPGQAVPARQRRLSTPHRSREPGNGVAAWR